MVPELRGCRFRSIVPNFKKRSCRRTLPKRGGSWTVSTFPPAIPTAIPSDIRRIGYFGSYARGDWGIGSDLDLVAVIEKSDAPFEARAAAWDLGGLPVAADLLVCSAAEWERLLARGGRFAETLLREVVWIKPD